MICKSLRSEVGRSRPRTRQTPSTRRSRRKSSPKPRSTEETETELNEQQDGQKEVPEESNTDKEVAENNDNPETTCKEHSITLYIFMKLVLPVTLQYKLFLSVFT